MPVEEQSNVASLTDSPRPHTLLHDGLEIQNSTLQQLERGAEPNVSIRGNRHSLPPDFLLPNIRTNDTSASSPHHVCDPGQPLDEATIANRTAALRRLNGVAPRHRRSESTRTRTSLSSQPIVVRTYSGSPTSRPQSDQRVSATMYDRKIKNELDLPSAEVFNFENILQAIEQEARDDVDAIAEICGRSKMSLANEYDAHMPPQGELMGAGPGGHPSTMVRSSLSQTLTPVEEASSINERLSDNTNSVSHDVNDVHQHQDNSSSNRNTRPKDTDIGRPGPRRQTLISYGKASSSASASFVPAAIPTKAQQKVLEQSTLPVMLFSDAALPALEASTTTLRQSKSSPQDEDSLITGKAVIWTKQELFKDPEALVHDPPARGGVSDSNRRQSSLLGSLPPWFSWTSKASVSAENERHSNGVSAASSLRGILARKGTHDRMEGPADHAPA